MMGKSNKKTKHFYLLRNKSNINKTNQTKKPTFETIIMVQVMLVREKEDYLFFVLRKRHATYAKAAMTT